MMKRLIDYIILVLAASLWPLAFTSCQDEVITNPDTTIEVPEGYKLLSFKADIPDMVEVNTRAIDEDGGGIQDLRLFCFNSEGLFLSTIKADITPDGDPSGVNVITGTYTAVVPENTQIVHFIANINTNTYSESELLGKHETEVIPSLTVSSGFMIYWQRVELSAGTTDGVNVKLLRNQAKFRINTQPDGKNFLFTVCNTTAYGTVAPFNASATAGNEFAWSEIETDVTLPVDKNYQIRLIPREEPTSAISYVFETENTEANPVYIILKDNDQYYKALVIDTDGNFLNIRRNTSYNINITGALSNGYSTLDEAIDGIATNNVWISIADNIRTISDGQFELSVDNTVFVYESSTNTQNATIGFSYKALTTEVTVTSPTVSLLENNEAITGLNSTFAATDGTGSITFTVNTLPEGESVRKAVILVKAGVLQRKITIYLIKKFEFTPSWVSTQVDANQAGEPVTLMFTIPEDFPKELFPFDVKIGADWLNVRESGGQVLSIITPMSNPEDFNDEGNFSDADKYPNGDPWTFKFVYRAEQSGVQRVYFNTTLPPTGAANLGFDKALLTIEADHFTMMEKQISFTATGNFITLANLLAVSGEGLGGNMPQDDDIYYRLVPQKKNAHVFFTVNTKKEDNNVINDVTVEGNDEFLIYTNYLTYYTDAELESLGITKDCNFLKNPNISGIGNGYYQAFKPITSGYSSYNIYMKTTRTNSAEVIRIASQDKGNKALFYEGEYIGQYFRSITFELANYHPFNFFASVTKAEETNPYTEWTYEPDQKIDVQFDVTSFRGADNRSADPFGTEFKVYIDAPMLEIDEERRGNYNPDVFYEESEGRFVLLIKADRNDNRLGKGSIAIENEDTDNDQTFENYPPDPNADQTGEHHVLPFKKKNIVSEGNITISADPEIVNFTTETIEISNKPVSGTIKYQNSDVTTDVPAGAFVTFALHDDTRIGVMNITTNGQYSMQLRSVYQFSWVTDPVVVKYRIGETAYIAEYPNLQNFIENRDVIILQNEP